MTIQRIIILTTFSNHLFLKIVKPIIRGLNKTLPNREDQEGSKAKGSSIRKLLLRNLRRSSIQKKRETTLSGHIRLNIRLRCAETGSFSKNANSKISVLLLMEIMKSIKKFIFLPTIKLKSALNSTKRCTALMVTDANSYILSTTLPIRTLIMRLDSLRMLESQWIESIP